MLRSQVEALLGQLQASYPAAFARGAPLPLAIGVHHQIIQELGCDPEVLANAMRVWCSRPAYLANLIDQSHRHGLDGAPVAELTAEERAAAAVQLAALRAAQRAKPKGAL